LQRLPSGGPVERLKSLDVDPSASPAPALGRILTAVRYVTPLREGGSLPALVEADDGNQYVLKFRGAGQGTRALIAEWIAGEVARVLGLPVPGAAVIQVDAALGKTEPDQEIGDLLTASVGTNYGLGYLGGAAMYTRGADAPPPAALASAIVWLDAYVMNVDRTVKNPNLLIRTGQLWLIDHGAALYWHHGWETNTDRSGDRFALVRDHVLLPWASDLGAVSPTLAARLTDQHIDDILDRIPDDWLTGGPFDSPVAQRDGYRQFLRKRRDGASIFVDEAINARSRLV
jgi:hypothetical protein